MWRRNAASPRSRQPLAAEQGVELTACRVHVLKSDPRHVPGAPLAGTGEPKTPPWHSPGDERKEAPSQAGGNLQGGVGQLIALPS